MTTLNKTLSATAIALSLTATGALAASHTSGTMDPNAGMDLYQMERGDLIRSRDIVGGDIYTIDPAGDESWDVDTRYDGVGADWNDIGEIEDIILSRDGQMIGIVGEVGGFLDIGDKHVLIRLDDVRLVPLDDGEYAYVTRMSEEQLEQLPEVDEGFWD